MEAKVAEKRGLQPLGRYVGMAVAGTEPDEMGIGPVFAVPKLLIALTLVLYGTVLEASALEGTLGKRLLGLRVHDLIGERLSWKTAFVRSSSAKK